jgi:hypothetical protein
MSPIRLTPTHETAPQRPGPFGPVRPRHWLPALPTTVVLGAARVWHYQGAAHSKGDAFLMGALALGAGYLGCAAATGQNGSPTLTGIGMGAAGTFAAVAVVGYSNGWALPVIVWSAATALVYGLAAKLWHTDNRAEREHRRAMDVHELNASTRLEIERTRAAGQVQSAEAHAKAMAFTYASTAPALVRDAYYPPAFAPSPYTPPQLATGAHDEPDPFDDYED